MEGAAIHDDSITPTLLGDVTFQTIPAVDASLYKLTSEEAAFFKAQIGIDDDEDLKRHILEVQAKAYKVSCMQKTSPQVEKPSAVERLHHILVFTDSSFFGA
jgi:hypothetical protein